MPEKVNQRDRFAEIAFVALLEKLEECSKQALLAEMELEEYIGVAAYQLADGLMKARGNGSLDHE